MRNLCLISVAFIGLLTACGGEEAAPRPLGAAPGLSAAPFGIDTTFVGELPEATLPGDPVTFLFEHTGPAVGFQARLDHGEFFEVPSPFTLADLKPGRHVFEVCAVNASGERDPEPAVHEWEVLEPVETLLTEAPAARWASPSVLLRFDSNYSDARYFLRVDDRPFTEVESSHRIELLDGPHQIEVYARAPDGRDDDSPLIHTFSIDSTRPEGAVVFPPDGALAIEPTVVARGWAADASGVVSEVMLAGLPASTIDGFAHWRAELRLDPGTALLDATIEDAAGNRAVLPGPVVFSGGSTFVRPRGVAVDAANDRALVCDADLRALVSVDLASGATRLISGEGRGSGPSLAGCFECEFDADNDRALVLAETPDGWRLMAVDVATGNREALGEGEFPALTVFWDGAHDRILVAERFLDRVDEIDSSGVRRTLFQLPYWAQGLTNPSDAAWDASKGRILATDPGLAARIVAIDPGTGQRTTVAAWEKGTHERLLRIAVTADGSTAYVLRRGREDIVAVDLATGELDLRSRGGLRVATVYDMALDERRGRVLFGYENERNVVTVDVETAKRGLLGDVRHGSGVRVSKQAYLTSNDSERDRMLVLPIGTGHSQHLYAVDAAGHRTVVSGPGRGAGALFGAPVGLGLDTKRDRVLVADRYRCAVFAVDPETGNRTILDGNISDAQGPWNAMAIDLARDRALVTTDGGAVLAVDLGGSGRTTLMAGDNANRGSSFRINALQAARFIPSRDSVLLMDRRENALYEFDADTGKRSLLRAFDKERPLRDLDVDGEGTRALVAIGTGLLLLDIATGTTVAEFPLETTSGAPRLSPGSPALTAGGDGAFFVIGNRGPLHHGFARIDLKTGSCVLVSR